MEKHSLKRTLDMQYVYKFVDKALNMHYFKGRE